MIEEFVQIPGPTFLMLFVGLVTVTISICWLWIRADGSYKYQLPDLTRFDSIAIAQLRGGRKLAVQTAMFQLYDQKLIYFSGEGRDAKVKIWKQSQPPSGAVENEIYRFVQSEKKLSDLFSDSGLQERIDTHLDLIQRELEQLHLSRTKSNRMRVWTITALAYLIMLGIGGTKLLLGIARGRPVIFLVLLLIASVIAAFVILKPTSIPTRLGRRYLKEMEKHFGWVKESIERGRVPEGIDPSLTIAIFGAGVLSGSTLYQPYREVFSPEKDQGGIWGSGGWVGGGGCSGGCGGGGCGGGGCGGCGG